MKTSFRLVYLGFGQNCSIKLLLYTCTSIIFIPLYFAHTLAILYIAGIRKEKEDATASAASANISNEKYIPLATYR